MNSFFLHFSESLAMTLLHSLWQGVVIGIIALFYILKYSKVSAAKAYHTCVSSIFLCLSLAIFTFTYYWLSFDSDEVQWAAANLNYSTLNFTNTGSFADSEITPMSQLKNWVVTNQSRIIITYLFGLFLFSLRLSLGLKNISKIRHSVSQNDNQSLQPIVNRLVDKINFKRSVQFAYSKHIDTPITIGHFKPMILFPLALINQLNLEETEAIIAHELAHIARADYLQNIIINISQAILFYHPVIWWLSNRAISEREKICDDYAIKITNGKLNYAKALIKVQELQINPPINLALSINANKKGLLTRIQRILNQKTSYNMTNEKILISALLILLCGGFISARYLESKPIIKSMLSLSNEEIESQVDQPTIKRLALNSLDTIEPIRSNRGRDEITSYNISKEDGEVLHMEVNGKVIAPEDYWKYSDIDQDAPVPPAPPSAPRAITPPAPPSAPRAVPPPAPPTPPRAPNRVFGTPPTPPAPPAPPKPYKSHPSQGFHFSYDTDRDTLPWKDEASRIKWEQNMEEFSENMAEFSESVAEWGEKFGEDFGKEFGEKMEKWGKKFEKNFGKEFEKDIESWTQEMEKWGNDIEDKYGKDIDIHTEKWDHKINSFAERMADWGARFGENLGESLSDSFSFDYEYNDDNSSTNGTRSKDSKSLLLAQLMLDNWINEEVENQKVNLVMTNDELKINGKKQSKEQLKKYQSLFSEYDSSAFENDTTVKFEYKKKNGKIGKQSLSISIED